MISAKKHKRIPSGKSCWLLIGLLTGCTVGPDYKMPATVANLPTGFVNAKQNEFSDNAIEISWWKLFNDPQLTQLVNQAIQHNYDLKAAKSNLAEARALYFQAGMNLLPSVTTHGTYTEQRRSAGALNNRAFVPRELKLFNAGFDASWEIDLFGRSRRNLEAANSEVQAEEAGLRDVAVSVTGEVARNYMQLRGLQGQLAVARKNVDIQSQTLDMVRVKLENGRGTELDTSRAQAQLETTRAGIPLLDNSIGQTLHRLSVLTGQVPTALLAKFNQPAEIPKAPNTIQIGSPEQLLRRRADIRVAERNLASTTASIGVATADLFPRVTFVGSIALEASTLSGMVAPAGDSYTLGPRISWAAFDMAKVYARIKIANAQAETSLAQYQQTVLTALEETENALLNYRQERARRTALAVASSASENAHRLAQLRYQEGVSDFLTVLNSEQQLLQDQSQLAQSETATATALVSVYKALGGGWEQVAEKPKNN